MSIINKQQHEARTKITVKDGETVALCRCWQSKKFPFCDGSHNKLNQDTKDNIGPIIVEGTS
jgi:CDGSH-type Zn-finger protein